MQAVYSGSYTAEQWLKATAQLEHVTHEPWSFDWEKSALVCKHGVAISSLSALSLIPAILRDLVVRRHFFAAVEQAQ